ncbi:nickel/cobalt transporter [Hansschlegelia plantiphila]|uniref:nickel/cobalt transporter n=1 Tax=Hansschlegelia plantiphila TaxID=374655 RepID=UPI0022F25142|nr:nickel/cobalt transporter [Hansschlegelia plantiphila]
MSVRPTVVIPAEVPGSRRARGSGLVSGYGSGFRHFGRNDDEGSYGWRPSRCLVVLAALACLCLAAGVDHALAQNAGPFGVGRPDASGPGSTVGMFAWIAEMQSAFYQALSGTIRSIRTDKTALASLVGLSFAYGVFHAAGPGHGKAVISSYLVATDEGFRRGVMLSALAALAQAATAIVVVGIFAVALGATSIAIGAATFWLEASSYAAILALGAVLLWRKGRGLARVARGKSAHVHGPDCAHDHGVDPAVVQGRFDWRRAGMAVMAVGLRPCTGALIVLVFALAQGLAWAGILATLAMAAGTSVTVAAIAAFAVGAKAAALRIATARPGAGALLIAGMETLGAVVILLFGALMLGGMIVTGAGGAG